MATKITDLHPDFEYQQRRLCSLMLPPVGIMGGQAPWGFTTPNSALMDGVDDYFSRTPAGAGTLTKHSTIVVLKRNIFGTYQGIFSSTATCQCYYNTTNDTIVWAEGGGSRTVTNVFRDTQYTILEFIWDSGNATAADRMKVRINGEDATYSATTDPALNASSAWNSTGVHNIGRTQHVASQYLGAYLSLFAFLNNTLLDPTDYLVSTGPTAELKAFKSLVDAAGTNSCYLDFSNGADLGEDQSTNGSDWTNNGSITQSIDTASDYQGGEQGSGLTFSAINYSAPGAPTNGNRTATGDTGSSNNEGALGTLYFDVEENWWIEFDVDAIGSISFLGLADKSIVPTDGTDNQVVATSGTVALYRSDSGNFTSGGVSGSAYGATYTTGDVIGVHISGGSVTFYKQTGGTGSFVSQGVAVSGLTGFWTINACGYGTPQWTIRVFESEWGNGSPPTGAKSINTANLTKSETIVSDHFSVTAYAGTIATTGTQEVDTGLTNANAIIIKNRTTARDWHWYDTLFGYANGYWSSNTAGGYTTSAGNGYASGQSAGTVTLTSGGTDALNVAKTSNNYIMYAFNLPDSETNTDGDISCEWIWNATLGVAIGKYTGNGSASQTIGIPSALQALGAPFMCWSKETTDGDHPAVYHEGYGVGYGYLNLPNAFTTTANKWPVAPSSTVINLTNQVEVNQSTKVHILWVFWETDLCKKVQYEGNSNADGAVAYFGGASVWMLQKNADAATNWHLTDNVRDTENVIDKGLYANLSAAEFTFTMHDVLTNSVKLRTSSSAFNVNTNIGVAIVQPPPAGAGQLRAK